MNGFPVISTSEFNGINYSYSQKELQSGIKNMEVQRRSSRLAEAAGMLWFLTTANSMDTLHNDELVGYEETTEEDGTFEPTSTDSTSTDHGTELDIDEEDEEELNQNDEAYSVAEISREQIDDGRSDFWPSDVEIDQDVVTHTQYNRQSADKYNFRGSHTFHHVLKNAKCMHQPPSFICTLHKYSTEEKRWINKGPVVLYFTKFGNRIHLNANYLYGIRTLALNMTLRERFETRIRQFTSQDVYFSTFGHNCVNTADIISTDVPLSQIFGNIPDSYKKIKVSLCKSQIRCVPEDRAAVICLRFLSSDVCTEFSKVIFALLKWVEYLKIQQRLASYQSPQYIIDDRTHQYRNDMVHTCPPIPEDSVNALALNGFHYSPVLDSASNTIRSRICCNDCQAHFFDVPNLNALADCHYEYCWMRQFAPIPGDGSNMVPDPFCVTSSL